QTRPCGERTITPTLSGCGPDPVGPKSDSSMFPSCEHLRGFRRSATPWRCHFAVALDESDIVRFLITPLLRDGALASAHRAPPSEPSSRATGLVAFHRSVGLAFHS